MDRDLWSIAIVAMLFLLFAGLLAAFGGVKEESHIWIRNIDIMAEAVDESEANITAIILVEHEGDAASDVELFAKVYDGETGLLLEERSVPVGTIEYQRYMDAKGVMQETKVIVIDKGKGLVETRLSFTVPREGSMRLFVELFEGNAFLTSREATISELSTLEVESDVALKIKDVDFAVNRNTGDRTLIDATAYIENLRSKDTPSLKMLIKAEDNETGLLVDETEVDIGTLAGSGTSVRSARLNLLNERDHLIDLTIWNGNKIVAEGYGLVALSPFGNRTEFIPVTGTVVEKAPVIDIEGFIPTPTPIAISPPSMGEGVAPSFGIAGVIVAFLLVLLMRRCKDGR